MLAPGGSSHRPRFLSGPPPLKTAAQPALGAPDNGAIFEPEIFFDEHDASERRRPGGREPWYPTWPCPRPSLSGSSHLVEDVLLEPLLMLRQYLSRLLGGIAL